MNAPTNFRKNGICRGESQRGQDKHLDHSPIVQHFKPFTAVRFLWGSLYLIDLALTSFVFVTLLAPPALILIRPLNFVLYRKISGFFFGHWLSMAALVAEKLNGTNVVFAGERVPPGERVILICNHRTEVDWMYLWNFAFRKDRIGYVKYVVKSSVRNVPMFGWACHLLEFLFLERRWEKDERMIRRHLASFQDPQDPLWLIIFPEGTDFTEKKKLRSQTYAAAHRLPKLEHTLLPRVRGFYASLQTLRGSVDALYNVTIGYSSGRPRIADHVFGTGPAEVHIHVERIPLDAIPASEEDVRIWLYKVFQHKDQLLESFYAKGSFPDQFSERQLSSFRGIAVASVFNAVSSYIVWAVFHGATWLLVYLLASAGLVAALSYFKWLPGPLKETLEPHTRGHSQSVADLKQE